MKYRYQSGDTIYEVVLERRGALWRVAIDGESYDVEVLDDQPGSLNLQLVAGRLDAAQAPADGEPDETRVVEPLAVYWAADGDTRWLSSHGCTYRLERPRERGRGSGSHVAPGGNTLRAPMPAQVRSVEVAEGDEVEVGQTLLLLEAMKMEIRLQSPSASRVARLLAGPGEQVQRDQLLIELEPLS